MITITGNSLVAAVEQLADEFPDRKADCVNWDVDGAHCIIGVALTQLDVPQLPQFASVGISALVHHDVPGVAWDISPRSVWFLADIQAHQDEGWRWRESVEWAIVRDADRYKPAGAVA